MTAINLEPEVEFRNERARFRYRVESLDQDIFMKFDVGNGPNRISNLADGGHHIRTTYRRFEDIKPAYLCSRSGKFHEIMSTMRSPKVRNAPKPQPLKI